MTRFTQHTLLFLLGFMTWSTLQAQKPKWTDQFMLGGYLSASGDITHIKNAPSTWQNLSTFNLHQRTNFAWYANKAITLHAELVNKWMWGNRYEKNAAYTTQLNHDEGWVDLKWIWAKQGNNFMYTHLDRFYVNAQWGNWEFNLGRQRVNWGRTLVWNPNDIFNTFSFYELDYPERPGTDALRITYYTNSTDALDLVGRLNNKGQLSLALRHQFHLGNYDLQALAGFLTHQDWVFGAGWEGQLGTAGFRGELTYYQPQKGAIDPYAAFLASIAVDYTFNAKLSGQIECLYNDKKHTIDLEQQGGLLFSMPNSSKSLSFSSFNCYAGLTYLLTPLVTCQLSGMYYPDQKGFFLMPNVSVSLSNNLVADLTLQYFHLKIAQERQNIGILWTRMKWNF